MSESVNLQEFWANNKVETVWYVSQAHPAGKELTHKIDTEDPEDYCDLSGPVEFLGDLDQYTGRVSDGVWAWDGDSGNPTDQFGSTIVNFKVFSETRERGMTVELRANNGGTTLLLIDAAGKVANEWLVTPKEMQDFLAPSDPADWAPTFQDYGTPDGYGELIATKTADGVEVVDLSKYVERVKFFGLKARHLGDIGVNLDTFSGVLYDVSFDIGNRSGQVMRGDYLGWEEALAGLIDDLPDSERELSSVHNCVICRTQWENGHGIGLESRSVNPVTRDFID